MQDIAGQPLGAELCIRLDAVGFQKAWRSMPPLESL